MHFSEYFDAVVKQGEKSTDNVEARDNIPSLSRERMFGGESRVKKSGRKSAMQGERKKQSVIFRVCLLFDELKLWRIKSNDFSFGKLLSSFCS